MIANPSAFPRLRLSLLGTPAVALDDKPMSGFVSSKSQALLYYLAVEDRVHDRQDLAALLWPDSSESRSLKNLRDVLSNLRGLVADYLEITRRDVAFRRTAPYWLDVEEFSRALGGPQILQNPERLTAALALYRDDFLGGFYVSYAPEYEQWATALGEQLRQRALSGFHALAEHHLRAGSYLEGLEVNGRMLALEPWEEAAHAQRMRLLVLAGQRTAAMRQYERCREMLAEEFGVEPSPETRDLASAIAAGRFPLEGNDADAIAPVSEVAVRANIAPQSNLPRMLTPFFGRITAVNEVAYKVRDPAYPLITIVGPGGVGKTRFALAVAGRVQSLFANGVWFVDLTHVNFREGGTEEEQWDRLAASVARAARVPLGTGPSLSEQLFNALQACECLLILDNFEQVAEAAPFVARLLSSAPGLTVIITSRVQLALQSAWVYRLGGLPLPDGRSAEDVEDIETLVERYAGLQLFVERARRRQAEFELTANVLPDVISICRQVEALPLGIELAAAMLRRYTPADLATQLEGNLGLLANASHDAPRRHHSLQATFETSWQLLSPVERRTLALSTVFRGSFGVVDATALVGATLDDLEGLVDKSLLQTVAPRRYRLNSVIRFFALQKRAEQPVEESQLLQRYAHYYMDFLNSREQRLLSDPAAIHEVRAELDNVQAAWEWACKERDLDALESGRAPLVDAYQWSGLFRAGVAALSAAVQACRVALAQDGAPGTFRALLGKSLLDLAFFEERLGHTEVALRYTQEGLRLGNEIGDLAVLSTGALRLAALHWAQGDLAHMEEQALQGLAIAQRGDLPRQQVVGHIGLALLATGHDEYTTPLEQLRTAEQLAEHHNLLRFGTTIHLNLALVLTQMGELAPALASYRRAAELHGHFFDPHGATVAVAGLARILTALGEFAEAALLLRDAPQQLAGYDRFNLCNALYYMAFNLLGQERYAAARDVAAQALEVAQEGGFRYLEEWSLLALGEARAALGEAEGAKDAFEAILSGEQTSESVPLRHSASAGLARALLQQGSGTEAVAKVDAMLAELRAGPFNPVFRSAEIYLACFQVLEAADDPRAAALLNEAYTSIRRIAATLPNAETRASYLENVPANREIRRLCEDAARPV